MTFEKTLKIRNKILVDADVRALWDFTSNQTKSNLQGTAEIVVVNDDEIVSSQSDDIFSTKNYRQKRIKRIELRYYSKDCSSRLTIVIEYVVCPYLSSSNYIHIQGESADWIELCASRVQHLLSNISTTSLLARLYNKCGLFITMVLFVMAFTALLLDFIIPVIRTLQPTPHIKFMLSFAVLVIGGVGFWLIQRTSSLFPVVSIDINGTMRDRNRNIRGIMKWLFNSIILPLLFGFIFLYSIGSTICKHPFNGA